MPISSAFLISFRMAEALEVRGRGSFSRGTHACGRVFLESSAFARYCCKRVVIRAYQRDKHMSAFIPHFNVNKSLVSYYCHKAGCKLSTKMVFIKLEIQTVKLLQHNILIFTDMYRHNSAAVKLN